MNTPGHTNGSTRRSVLKAIGMASLLGTPAAPLMARRRTAAANANVLWLMSDEHSPFVAGYAGNRVVRTPHLDGLARASAEFSACYTPDPICVPSRKAFATGRMASNLYLTPSPCEAMGPYFTRMGFETGWFGKQGWEDLDNRFSDEGESCDSIVEQRFHDAGMPLPDSTRFVKDAKLAFWGTDLNEDTVATDQALAFLDRVGSRRFFLGVSYVKPHFPYCIQPEYHALYAARPVPRPRVTDAMLNNLSTAMKQDRETFKIEDLTLEQSDFGRAVYYGMVSYMDEQVGRVLARLDQLGLRDNTIVVYMSDHGEMLGQHGIWYKNAFLEGSARVPLLVSLPGMLYPPLRSRIAAPVNSIDIFPTLCEACGLQPPPSVEGQSLLPLMDGRDPGTERVAFSENRRRGIPSRMIRTAEYKYCYYEDGVEQLYDMRGADRDVEGTNLAADPAHATLKADLKRRALEGWNPDGLFDNDG